MTVSTTSKQSLSISKFSEAMIPLELGTFHLGVYRNNLDSKEAIVLSKNGNKPQSNDVFVRIHSECFTGEVLGSLKCDCKHQLEQAMRTLAKTGEGLIIYLKQEGRGIGLGNKIKAYDLQNRGLDTVAANKSLGFPNDLRDFSIAALILKDLGVKSVKLNTNNPDKISSLKENGIDVTTVVPSFSPINPHNFDYLKTKHQNLGHKLGPLFEQKTNKV